MEMIESFLRSIGIEAEIMDIPKMMIWDMDDHFFDEFDGWFDHIMSFIVCVIMIIPMDLILFSVVGDDAALSDTWPSGIAHGVGDTSIDIITEVSGVKVILFFGIVCINIETIRMILIGSGADRRKRRTNGFLKKPKDLILESLAKHRKIQVMKIFDLVFGRIIDPFRNQSMDMRVPFEIPAKGMESSHHTEIHGMPVVLEKIIRAFQMFLFHLLQKFAVGKGTDRITGGGKQELKTRTILPEKDTEFFRNGEDDMTMRNIKTKRRNPGGKLFGILYTAGGTETGMTGTRDNGEIITMFYILTFEIVVAEINGATEEGTLYIIKDTGTSLTGLIKVFEKIEMIEEDGAHGMRRIVIDKIQMMGIIMTKDAGGQGSIDHKKSISQNTGTANHKLILLVGGFMKPTFFTYY